MTGAVDGEQQSGVAHAEEVEALVGIIEDEEVLSRAGACDLDVVFDPLGD